MLRDRRDSHDRAIQTFDHDKLERLVLYVARCVGAGRLGATTLNRVLWYADAQVFELTGRSITGARYFRHQDGPMAGAIVSILSVLEQNGVMRTSPEATDVSFLSNEEIAVLDRWIERVADGKANVESSLDYAWRIAELGEEIPMAATLAGRIQKPSDDEIRWGKDVATKLALP